MKERPILFSAPMVQAILRGDKTQTRRVLKPQPTSPTPFLDAYMDWGPELICPYGTPGDRLWVRERHWRLGKWLFYPDDRGKEHKRWCDAYRDRDNCLRYAGDDVSDAPTTFERVGWATTWHWRNVPSIYMRRWASRITLEITNIRIERVHAITDADVHAEGVTVPSDSVPGSAWELFAALWDRINDKRGFGWGKNPWVWVVEFERIKEQNND